MNCAARLPNTAATLGGFFTKRNGFSNELARLPFSECRGAMNRVNALEQEAVRGAQKSLTLETQLP